MARKQFETVVAQAPKKHLIQLGSSPSTPLGNGTYETIYFYAPANEIAKCIGLCIYANAPTGATSGEHHFYVSYDLPNAQFGTLNLDLIYNSGTYAEIAGVQKNIHQGSRVLNPVNEGLPTVIANLVIDQFTPLIISYQQNCGVTYSQARNYAIALISEEVAPL